MNHAFPHVNAPARSFTQLLSATRRGARLARLLTLKELRSWGAPEGLAERAELVVAELAANAVLHGSLPGRGFRLTLAFDPSDRRLRVDVTDSRGDRCPQTAPAGAGTGALPAGGRGLWLVAALADHWETIPHPPSGKTVRAVLSMPAAEE
ncbi:ATP-binding protein [Streptomyces sodiiphilus]|uniref:ATP-binding protein n=1 Tax=Streptomyces sodiiphilus TaxID=226217 RepID=A0ABP5A064_9ACTN